MPRGPWCESPAPSRFSRPGTQQPSQGTAAFALCASLAAKSHAAESGFTHVSWVGFSSLQLCRGAAKCVSVQELSREIKVTGKAEDWLCQLAPQRTSVLPPCRMLSEEAPGEDEADHSSGRHYATLRRVINKQRDWQALGGQQAAFPGWD